MAKKRVHEIAKAHGLPSKTVLDALQADGHDIATASSSVDESVAVRLIQAKGAELKSSAATDEAAGTPAKPETTTSPAAAGGSDAPAAKPTPAAAAAPAPARPVRPQAPGESRPARPAAPGA
ncbi:translation initiation factor IF-2 N-terminal domain-containing protein, partial [Patulibacter sp.]|uniref:translation initiation factor IF-2 N-terminal domain-containing protein n=1 Tax=Patulibacter sp. TaxID=1912859 RepID=UPI0027289FE4